MFQFILDSSDAAVEKFVFSSWAAAMESLAPALVALSIVFVAAAGYLLWAGRIEMSRSEIGIRLLQLVFVVTFVTNVEPLERFFYRVATDVPGSIATTLTRSIGETDGDINRALDDIFVNGVETGGRILDRASITDLGTVLIGLTMIGVTLIALVPVAFVLILSKLAVGVLLGLAPFAVLLYLLPATRSLFVGYLQQLLGFALIPTMIYALLGLVLSMVSTVSDAVANDAARGLPELASIAPYVLVMLVVGLLATQVVVWSSGIAGALSLSAQGLFSRPATLGLRSLEAVQAGRRAAAAVPGESRAGRAAAFTSGALRQGLGLRPPRTADPFFRSER